MDNQEARARVDVIEADREAAAHVYASFRDHDFAGWIRKGENAGGDANFIIQLFARHRLAFTKHPEPRPSPSREAIARAVMAITWKREQYNGVGPDYEDYREDKEYSMGGRVERYEQEAGEIADAILALQPADRAREVLAEATSRVGIPSPCTLIADAASIRAMLRYAAECVALERERAAKVAEGWTDPIEATAHENCCFAQIAATIRAG